MKIWIKTVRNDLKVLNLIDKIVLDLIESKRGFLYSTSVIGIKA